MYLEIIKFLLKIPPLQEIGGKITHIIEQHRAGILDEQTSTARILKEHTQYIKDYVGAAAALEQQLY